MFPARSWLGELRDQRILRTDILAGVTVALVLIPQSMAYAQLAGLPAYYGLYASFMPPLVAALFGSSRQLQTGPVAIVSIMTAAALEPLATAGSASFVAYAIVLALLVGLFELALGLLRLGALVNFLAHPVIIGFTNAAAIIIATSQLSKVFGVFAEKGDYYFETIWNVVQAVFTDTHWPTLGIAVLAFVIMIGVRRINPRLPNVLIAVVVTTLIAYYIEFERVDVIKSTQIVNTTVRNLISEQLSSRDQLARLDLEISAANERFIEVQKTLGRSDPEFLDARHRLDSLRLHKERHQKTIRQDRIEIKDLRFRRVKPEGDESARFYLTGETPTDESDEGHLWRVFKFNPDDSIVMSGGGAVVGNIPRGLPALKAPDIDFGVLAQLLPAAITIALLGFMEAISIAKAMAARTKQRVDANQELIGQGLANIVGGLFQSYPVSGSFSRSAVNLGAGAITGFSSVVTSLIVVIVLLWFTPLLYHLPQATLAAVIMMAVVGLINPGAFKHIWKTQPSDGMVAAITFFLTLALAPHLDYGFLMGAAMALGLYLLRTMRPRVVVLGRHRDGTLRDAELYTLETCPNISMIRFDGSLYFANTSYFEDKVLERSSQKPDLKFVIVDGAGINEIDATGEEMLAAMVERLQAIGVQVIFTEFKLQAYEVLQRSGFIDKVGEQHFFRNVEKALRHVWHELGDDHADICPLNPHRQSAQV